MKNLILISMFLVLIMSVSAQDSTQMVTVKDTIFISDARLIYFSNTILPAVNSFIDDYNRTRKVSGETVLLKQETNQLIKKIEKLVQDYSRNFMVVKNTEINPVEIVNEYNALNAKIAALQSDPEIKYIEAMTEFQRIKERQAVLSNYYKQIYSK